MTQYGPPGMPPTAANDYGHSWQVPTFTPAVRYEPAAIIALVLSLMSFIIWILPALVAIAMGHAAKRNIDASNGSRRGRSLATAAQVIAFVAILFTTILFGVLLLTS